MSQVDLARPLPRSLDHPLRKNEAIDSYNLMPVLEGREVRQTPPSGHRPEHLPEKIRPPARGLGLYQCPDGSSQEGKSRLLGAFRPQGIRERS